MSSNLTIQFVERMTKLLEHVMTAGRQPIDARRLRSFGLGRAQPPTLSHAGEDRIQRSRTQAVAVVMQLFEHPLAVHAASVSGMVKDVNLPERQQEFSRYRIAHRAMIAPTFRNRKAITRMRFVIRAAFPP
jgi:hypothetical protein